MRDNERIVNLIKKISTEINYERGAICAVDCLLQWELGLLTNTILAWENYLAEVKNKEGHTTELRHGAWVPAIPLTA
jgi:hypothetical protein